MERFGLLQPTAVTVDENTFVLPWVKIDAAQLQKHYYVSWPSLLAGDKPPPSDEESEAEAEPEEGFEKGPEPGVVDETEEAENQRKERKKKKKKAKPVGDDYDFEDPFIDDDEAPHAVYESIFDLMAQANSEEEEDGLEGIGQDQRRQRRQFYVFRGKLSSLREGGAESDPAEAEEQEKRKRSRRSSVTSSPKRKAKKEQAKPKKKPKLEKPAPKAKSALAMIMALDQEEADEVEIAAAAEDEGDDSEPKESGSASQRPRGSPVKPKQVTESDRQYADLELKLALELFSTQAARLAGTFDPVKFPSALRNPLTDSVMAQARLSALLGESPSEMVTGLLSLFDKLATWVPYSAASLRKLVMKRILPVVAQELEMQKLPSHYQSIGLITNQTVDLTLANPDLAKRPPEPEEQMPASSQPTPKFRVTEPLREVIYEIVRFEWDLLLIRRISRLFDESQAEAALVEPMESEHTHRKNIYIKIHRSWSERWELTTYDISREYSNIKRKVERALMKKHGVEVAVRKRERKAKDPEPAFVELPQTLAPDTAVVSEMLPLRLLVAEENSANLFQ